jgi:hypothetical protein
LNCDAIVAPKGAGLCDCSGRGHENSVEFKTLLAACGYAL